MLPPPLHALEPDHLTLAVVMASSCGGPAHTIEEICTQAAALLRFILDVVKFGRAGVSMTYRLLSRNPAELCPSRGVERDLGRDQGGDGGLLALSKGRP
jgi:hypothetical protein